MVAGESFCTVLLEQMREAIDGSRGRLPGFGVGAIGLRGELIAVILHPGYERQGA